MNTNSTNEDITFLKWWEIRRILFNLIVFICIFSIFAFYGQLSKIDSYHTKLFTAIFLYTNIFYSIPSLIGLLYKLTIRTFDNSIMNSFFYKKRYWKLLFYLLTVIFFLGLFLLVFIGGSSSIPRHPHPSILY